MPGLRFFWRNRTYRSYRTYRKMPLGKQGVREAKKERMVCIIYKISVNSGIVKIGSFIC